MLREHRVFRDIKVLRGFKVMTVLDLKVLRASKVFRDIKVLRVIWVFKEYRASKAIRVTLESKVLTAKGHFLSL